MIYFLRFFKQIVLQIIVISSFKKYLSYILALI